jgi:hypothetical protein
MSFGKKIACLWSQGYKNPKKFKMADTRLAYLQKMVELFITFAFFNRKFHFIDHFFEKEIPLHNGT